MNASTLAKWWSLPGMLLCGAVSAADDTALAQCAAVDNPDARLACYDAVAGRGAPGSAGAPDAPGAPAVPAAAAAPSMAEFGLRVVDKSPQTMTARVAGKFTEWGSGTLIKLDNGQVWRVVEDRSAVYPNMPENAEVEITRGIFGYRMEIKPIGRRISVKRIS